MFFKEYIQKRALKKIEYKRDARYMSIREIESLAFLFSLEEEGALKVIDKLLKISDSRSIKVNGVAFNREKTQLETINLDSRIKIISKRDLKYAEIPNRADVENFLGQNYSILVDFNSLYHFPNHFLANAVKARFKIGRFNYQDNPFDLILKNKSGNIRDYLNSLIHYLSAIRFDQ